jgi:thioredoxin-related protein
MLGVTGQCVHARDVEWLTDAPSAQEKARRERKMVLLDFTGSDWCAWCIKLKSEVFDKPEFADYAREKLVMVEVDFPRHKALSPSQREANQRLQQTYQISGYPTIIVLNPDGQPIARSGYAPGGPDAFIASLERISKIIASQPQAARAPESEPEPKRKPVAWTPSPPTVPLHYGALALKAISGTKERRMVLINNASLVAGETAKVRAEDKQVVVLCKEIREDSVLITCDGKPMELKLRAR